MLIVESLNINSSYPLMSMINTSTIFVTKMKDFAVAIDNQSISICHVLGLFY